MEAALDRIVTVDDCNVYVRKCCYKLLGCEFLELDLKRILCDVFNCCVDACAVLELDDVFLCKEKKCSCFVCYVVGYCDYSAFLKILQVLYLTCVYAERFIVNCACRNECGIVFLIELLKVRNVLEIVCIK